MLDPFAEPVCALHAALIAGDKQAALRLLASGVDVNTKDVRELVGVHYTALHYAVDLDDAALIDEIITRGADVDAQTNCGQTALWLACNAGCNNAIHALLKNGANPNIKNSEGYTPLGRVLGSDSATIELLRSFGAND